jgi:streptogramin lyase
LEVLESRCLPSGLITEFSLPATFSQPARIALGPDGNLWFTESGTDKIGRITPAGTITEFDIPTAKSSPFGITLGPDGNLWFVEQQGDKVGRITPAGTITEFTIPTASSAPLELTAGPDGNLWFTESAGNQIGRITPSGTITEFAGLTTGSNPAGITAGPDGNLWFAESKANQIGRITTSGTVTEFVLPTPVSSPVGITAGPDGNLWFTENFSDQIGRITPSGTITEFPIPTSNSFPDGITLGPDKALWFTESGGLGGAPGNQVGRITVAGTISEFAVPTSGSEPRGIATGPDGDVWFTEFDFHGNKIGRVNLNVTVTAPDFGGGPDVRVFDTFTGQMTNEFAAYNGFFQGGVRVAVADINGDGVPDIITAPGPTGGPDIRVFDGATGNMIREFLAYDFHFLGGVYVAAADVNGDGVPDIVTAPDQGGGPDVRVFDGKTGALIQEFMAYDPQFEGGVRIAAGAVTTGGKADIITAPGPSGGPDIRIFAPLTSAIVGEFMAYDPAFTGGVYVAAGDVNGDGRADIVTAPGANGGPDVRVFDGATLGMIREFAAYAPSFLGGVRVAVVQGVNGKADIVTAPGAGGGPDVRVFDGQTTTLLDEYYAYDPHFLGGVFVGG